MQSLLILVVGASGVGKDTLLDGVKARLNDYDRFVFARRTITRAHNAGGEDHESVSEEAFDAMVAADRFFIDWQAHGFRYGLATELLDQLNAGKHVIANVSRSVLGDIARVWDNVVIFEITASPDTIAARLKGRGRESDQEISQRLQRSGMAYPSNLDVVSIANDTTVEFAIDQFAQAVMSATAAPLKVRRVAIDTWHDCICYLHNDCTTYDAASYLGLNKLDIFNKSSSIRAKLNIIKDDCLVAKDEIGLSSIAFDKLGLPEGSEVVLERTPSPKSTAALRTKIAGDELTPGQLDMIVRDIAEDRYSRREISAFLVSASNNLNLDELEALARARAAHSQELKWPFEMIVDKHSMGGVAGSRITLIVIPIVAAHGMIIPKTSSRAITSASGTADAMEVLTRVDLSQQDVLDVVAKTGGCIAWNGNLNHSAVDDVMNSITRPLAIDSQKWSVASILSKKLAAGSTHVIVDIPFGKGSKTPSAQDADALKTLFKIVGNRLGLEVDAMTTCGSGPIGRGIGPALEVRDVFSVLRCDVSAPADLRDKALDFAGRILEWDANVSKGGGRALAAEILSSGRALATLEQIIEAQGRKEEPDTPSPLISEVRASASGTIVELQGNLLSGIARRAGAPFDKGAGVDLVVGVGETVTAGDPTMLVHASTQTELSAAVDYALHADAFEIR